MGKLIHGAIVRIVFAGKQIGILTGLTENEDYGLQPQYTISRLAPYEIVAMRFSGDFSYSKLVIAKDSVADIQAFARSDKTEKEIVDAILTQEGFTIVIENDQTNDPIAVIDGCKTGNLSLNVNANAIITQSGRGMYGTPAVLP